MKKSLGVIALILVLMLAGCRSENPGASEVALQTDQAAFISSMGCNDPNCTDASHYHDCPTDCTDYDHYHQCALDCTETSHHHSVSYETHHDDHHDDNHH